MALFSVPPGADFARTFAEGFWQRFADESAEAIPRISILVNNRRSVRVLEEALMRAAGRSMLLPRLEVLAELGGDPLAAPDLTLAIPPLRRHLRLTALVEAYLRAEDRDGIAPLSAAPDLARALATLLDEFDEEGIALQTLDAATEGEHASHWDRTLRFIDLIRRHWPRIMAESEGGALNPKARQRAVIEAQIAAWATDPPSDPVIAAASTGSATSSAEMMAAIAALPRGMVVLPGFDRDMAPEIWEAVSKGKHPEHPYGPFVGLMNRLGAIPDQAEAWVETAAAAPRLALLSQALRPAPVTDAWHQAAPQIAADLDVATHGLTLIEAANPRAEAAAIAAATRHALETPQKTVLIVVQDAGIARRIVAELGRFRIDPDDSLGQPLAQSAPGTFLRLIMEVAARPADPVRLAGLLQHPLMAPGLARGLHLRLARRYEREVLRKRIFGARAENGLPDWSHATRKEPPTDEETAWLGAIDACLRPFINALHSGASLGDLVALHLGAATTLSTAGDDEPPAVWDKETGAAALRLLTDLEEAADAYGAEAVTDYPGLLLTLMRGAEIRPEAQTPHPRVTMLSPREARVMRADLTIMAGLNEGGWPKLPSPDPWLSRQMRAALGLPMVERVIGLSAHDFLMGAAAEEVIVSRALKIEGTPTVAARWLIRLETLIDGVDRQQDRTSHMEVIRGRGQALLALAQHTHQPDSALSDALPRAARPAPTPPVAARPRQLSVTEVETLVRDPYAIYARKILGLHPLDPLSGKADFRDRGQVVHKILEAFTRATLGALPQHAEAVLMAETDRVLATHAPGADLRRIWRARIQRFAPWFLEGEALRRQTAAASKVEIKGQMTLPDGFVIRARADRIDLDRDGGAAIYDYKTGEPPSPKMIENGFNQQLHLQAAILAEGGFEGLARARAHLGAYLGLTGSKTGGKISEVAPLDEQIPDHLAMLERLLAAYGDMATGYMARARMQKATDPSDYDHLSRFGEWEVGDE